MNGILQVKAQALSSGNEVSAEISTAGVKPKPIIDLSKWEQAKNYKRYRPIVHKAEKLIAADSDGADELMILVTKIKEAVLLENSEIAEEVRDELVILMRMIEDTE